MYKETVNTDLVHHTLYSAPLVMPPPSLRCKRSYRASSHKKQSPWFSPPKKADTTPALRRRLRAAHALRCDRGEAEE